MSASTRLWLLRFAILALGLTVGFGPVILLWDQIHIWGSGVGILIGAVTGTIGGLIVTALFALVDTSS